MGILNIYAQNFPEKGVPWLENFSPNSYGNTGKIWQTQAAKNGILYMASDNGLLEYDGETWNHFKGSKGFTRSILVESDSLIYTGSDLDFGVWKRNKFLQFRYTSLYPFKKDAADANEEFWGVYKVKDNIVFISFNNIYVYKNKQLTKIAAPFRFTGSFFSNGKIYLPDEKYGLFVFEGLSLKPVFNLPANIQFQISGVYDDGNQLTIITKTNGLFSYNSGKISPIQNTISDNLKKDQVFCFTPIEKRYFAFGTILNGVYITDLNGKIIQHINKQKGLLNNTILSLYFSPFGKLWMGLDYGISSLFLRNNLTYFFDYKGEFGTGYTALLKDDIFYLGTNQGLYKANWNSLNNDVENNIFNIIPGSEGQVWTMENVNGTLLCGHDKGLFEVNGNTINQIHNEHGVWTIVPYQKDYLLTGNYNGICVFKKNGSTYSFVKKIDKILGSCNQLVLDKNNTLWVNIPNYGIIKTDIDANFNSINRTIFDSKKFVGNLPTLFKNKTGIHVKTDKYIYTYIENKNTFSSEKIHNQVNAIQELLSGIYPPVSINGSYEFYPINNGFALKNLDNHFTDRNLHYQLCVRRIEGFNNNETKLFFNDATIPYPLNNVRFHFIVPQQNTALYQYKLENHSDEWSDWTPNNSVSFLNLTEGQYTLLVKGSVNGKVTDIKKITFRVSPPWFRSWFAYLFYLLLIGVIIYFLRKWQELNLKKQKKKMLKKEQNSLREQAEKHEQEVLLHKQQQWEYEKDLLKQQVKDKTMELAKKAKEDEEKNRLLNTLREKIEDLQNNPSTSKLRWAEIRRLLDSHLKTEDKTFEIQMDELHQEFFKILKSKYKELSIYDLRLCAYLKIGLNSKEISEIMNVLPSSINVSRSRLRKKLNLSPDEDLFEFLNKLK